MYKNDNSALDVLSYFPLISCNAISCPLYNLVMRIQMMCYSQEPQHLHVYFPIIPLVTHFCDFLSPKRGRPTILVSLW